MSDFQKVMSSTVLSILSVVAVYNLWKLPIILVPVLLLISILMIKIDTSKRSLVVYLVGFIFGPIAESVTIHAGAWQYAQPDFLGIPIWLPFLWANAALFAVNTERLAHFVLPKKYKD